MVRTQIDMQQILLTDFTSPNCRKRLWRSEIEVTLGDRDAALESLETRQKRRQPCTCIPSIRGEDQYVTQHHQLSRLLTA
jgi:hypothetical protein